MLLHRRQIADKVKAQFVNSQLTLHFDYIESELGKTEWFAGNELTAADVHWLRVAPMTMHDRHRPGRMA